MRFFTSLMGALALFGVFTAAQAATGPGDALPHSLAAKDQSGADQTFDTLKGENGAVLVFTRSADWCPFCQRQMIDLNAIQSDLAERGYTLVSVSYDSVEKLQVFGAKHGIAYKMLSDPDSEIIKAFGILNEEMKPGSRFYGIPHPAIYIVSSDGTVEAVLKEENYRDRPEPQLILDTIDRQ